MGCRSKGFELTVLQDLATQFETKAEIYKYRHAKAEGASLVLRTQLGVWRAKCKEGRVLLDTARSELRTQRQEAEQVQDWLRNEVADAVIAERMAQQSVEIADCECEQLRRSTQESSPVCE